MPASPSSHHGRLSFDIFCSVVDNYGDIGVCWRLARQLAHASHRVRLWVDNLESFQKLEPDVDVHALQQRHCNVSIVHWHTPAPVLSPHSVVIEAFGCHLPADFVERMADHNSLWLNLEYLSAEPWVDDFHLQPSIQASGIDKYFFFPGFTASTGGLLREAGLIDQRDAWLSHPRHRMHLLEACGVTPADIQALSHDAQLIFLFCYPDAPVHTLISTLVKSHKQTIILIPEGIYPAAQSTPDGKVRIYHIPFVRHTDFDHLLWSADLNVVRGEDSLVRALWASRPMIWQPYPQDHDAHLTKLDAWLARSTLHADTQALIRSWNTHDHHQLETGLLQHQQPETQARWATQCRQWTAELTTQTDLATALTDFCAQHRRTG